MTIFRRKLMENYCAFSKNHKCMLWTDYELTRLELEEATELCHGNWIEIQRKHDYVQALQKLLKEHDIVFPDEFDF